MDFFNEISKAASYAGGEIAKNAGYVGNEIGKNAGYAAHHIGNTVGYIAEQTSNTANEAGKLAVYKANEASNLIDKDLAKKAGLHKSELSRYRNNKQDLYGDSVVSIMQALPSDAYEFFTDLLRNESGQVSLKVAESKTNYKSKEIQYA